jgi:hypothetical protein
MREVELRVGSRPEAEAGGECLARWVRRDGVSTAKRGSLFVKRGRKEVGKCGDYYFFNGFGYGC